MFMSLAAKSCEVIVAEAGWVVCLVLAIVGTVSPFLTGGGSDGIRWYLFKVCNHGQCHHINSNSVQCHSALSHLQFMQSMAILSIIAIAVGCVLLLLVICGGCYGNLCLVRLVMIIGKILLIIVWVDMVIFNYVSYCNNNVTNVFPKIEGEDFAVGFWLFLAASIVAIIMCCVT